MRALFYDNETSGMPLWHDPSEDPRQPHIVQLGARLVDLESRDVISTIDLIVQPDGWEIPDDVAAVHGITTDYAKAVGVPEPVALAVFCALWERSEMRIAHNQPFDARIIRIGLKRFAGVPGLSDPDVWKDGPYECTATMSTPILNLPPTEKMLAARRTHPKTPNLREAYEFFTGQKLENAHSALADVDACITVYFAMLDRLQA